MRDRDNVFHILNYFKENISRGYPMESLKWALINQGYSRYQVLKAIDIYNQEKISQSEKQKEKPVIKHEIYDNEDNLLMSLKKPSFWKRLFG